MTVAEAHRPCHNTPMRSRFVLAVTVLLGCSSSTTTVSDGGDAATDDTHPMDGDMDMGAEDTALVDVGPVDAAGEHTVTVSNFKYSPSTITIKVGETVTWRFTQGTHTVTSGTSCTKAAGFDSGVHGAPYVFTQTFTTAGTFDYFCDYREHCTAMGQVGKVIVTP